jgi:SAM-dependent methyltransferase
MKSANGRRPPRVLPFRFREIRRRFGSRPFSILDVGAGNHSASLTKACFPNCHYAGIDRDRSYNNDPADFSAMDEFFELDLTTLDFDSVPDERYDVVMLAHVIEHLWNGDEVLRRMATKVRPGGFLYAEFPGPRSVHLPSKKGTLNFYDDDTHVRLFSASEVAGLLASTGLQIARAGTRRDPLGILLTPLHALKARLTHGYVPGGVFWDLFGFADVVIADRPRGSVPSLRDFHYPEGPPVRTAIRS